MPRTNHLPDLMMGFRRFPVAMSAQASAFARNTGPNDSDTPPTPAPAPEPVTAPTAPVGLTQAQVDNIVQQRIARERATHTANLAALGIGGDGQPSTVEEYVASQRKADTQTRASAGKHEELYNEQVKVMEDNNRRHKAELDTLRQSIRSSAVSRTLLTETARSVKPNQVAQLLTDRVRYDDQLNESYVVHPGSDNRMVTTDGQPFSVKMLVDQFLADNPHFQRASNGTGSGSTTTNTPNNQTSTQPGEYDLSNPDDRAKMLTDLGLNPEAIRNPTGMRSSS